MRTWALISACGLVLLVHSQEASKYSIIVDAGSSGSRLRMFMRTQGRKLEQISPNDEDEDSFEVEPGLSAFADEPKKARESLDGLFKAAQDYIPREYHGATPCFLKATAGMRLIPAETLQAILSNVSSYIASSNVAFDFVSAEVLAGEEEAVFGFIGMNYLFGREQGRAREYDLNDAVGILDMGGASVEVAFMPMPEDRILANEFQFYLEHKRHSVYATSFTKFGLDEALTRLLTALAEKSGPDAKRVDCPCFNRDYQEVVNVLGRNVNFVGTGDNEACSPMVHQLFHPEYECLLPPCTVMGRYTPAIQPHTGFYAIGVYFYTAHILGLVDRNESKSLSPSEILSATQEYCAKNYQRLRGKAEPKLRKYLGKYCFGGYFVWWSLKLFGFANDSMQLTFTRKLNGERVDWTTGAAIYETELMPISLSSRSPPCIGSTPEGVADRTGQWAIGMARPLASGPTWTWDVAAIITLVLFVAGFALGVWSRSLLQRHRQSSRDFSRVPPFAHPQELTE